MNYQELVNSVVARGVKTNYGLEETEQSLVILDTCRYECPETAALTLVSAFDGKYDMVSIIQVLIEMLDRAMENRYTHTEVAQWLGAYHGVPRAKTLTEWVSEQREQENKETV